MRVAIRVKAPVIVKHALGSLRAVKRTRRVRQAKGYMGFFEEWKGKNGEVFLDLLLFVVFGYFWRLGCLGHCSSEDPLDLGH